VIINMPGVGTRLGAEFLAATGGDMTAFGTADLAAFAGLAPVARDSGRVSGYMRRPRRYHRGLLRVFYLSSQASLRCCPASRTYYDRKVRHEALFDRVEVKDLRLRPVAAGRMKLGAA
jgi:transposase